MFATLIVFPSPLGVRQFCFGLLELRFEGRDGTEDLFVLELGEVVFFGGKGPKIVGATDFIFFDNGVVNERLVDVDDSEVHGSADVGGGVITVECDIVFARKRSSVVNPSHDTIAHIEQKCD